MIREWRRFTRYPRREAAALTALVFAIGIGVLLDALLPWPLKLIIDHVLPGRPLPEIAGSLVPGADRAAPTALLAWLAGGLLLIFVLSQTVLLLRGWLLAGVNARMKYALGAELFAHLQSLSLLYHRRRGKGDLIRRVTTDTDCVPTLFTGGLLGAFTSVVTLVLLFAIMWSLDRALTVVALLVATPMAALIRVFGRRMSAQAYRHQEAEGALWSTAEQSLTALPLVQAFGREKHEESRFRRTAAHSVRAYLSTIAAQLQFKAGVDGSEALGVALIMGLGGMRVLEGAISVGTLIVFLSYLAVLYSPLKSLAYLSVTLATAAAGARRVMEVLECREMVRDEAGARDVAPPRGGRTGSVAFENVSFGYQPGRPVLRNIDFKAAPGEVTALVGPSGAGKSTLVSLVPRLIDPWEGRILIDGQDIRKATLSSVRAKVSMVLQDSLLLPISLAENIAYARPEATRDEILGAAAAARVDEFASDLPMGYDTVIGERGRTLSGGQRQRIAIARALLKNAPILILDEPSSALDTGTEHLVMAALQRLMAGRTTFIIAHRLSTLRHADRILVLEDGAIVESGTERELLRAGGLYRRLHRIQYPDALDRTAKERGLAVS